MMKKKTIYLALLLLTCVMFTSCSGEDQKENGSENLTTKEAVSGSQENETRRPETQSTVEPESSTSSREDWKKVILDGYSYSYPDKWAESERVGTDSHIEYLDSRDTQDISMVVNAIGPVTLKQYADSMEKGYNSMEGYVVEKCEDRTFGGMNGKKLIISYSADGQEMILEQHFAVADQMAYCATYVRPKKTSADAVEQAEEIIDSVLIDR